MEALFSQLTFWHWFGFAVILAILDVVVGANFFFLWSGLCAAMVAISMLIIPKLGWELQLFFFAVGVLLSLFIWRQYLRQHPRSAQGSMLNRRADRYIGRVFTLEEAIVNNRGKVRVEDTIWRVQGEDLPVGSKVEVIGVDGTILLVKRH